jgi:hypothetical protein
MENIIKLAFIIIMFAINIPLITAMVRNNVGGFAAACLVAFNVSATALLMLSLHGDILHPFITFIIALICGNAIFAASGLFFIKVIDK